MPLLLVTISRMRSPHLERSCLPHSLPPDLICGCYCKNSGDGTCNYPATQCSVPCDTFKRNTLTDLTTSVCNSYPNIHIFASFLHFFLFFVDAIRRCKQLVGDQQNNWKENPWGSHWRWSVRTGVSAFLDSAVTCMCKLFNSVFRIFFWERGI